MEPNTPNIASIKEQQGTRALILGIIIALAIVAVFFFLYPGRAPLTNVPQDVSNDDEGAMEVVVENNRAQSGALIVPTGLPRDLPLESGDILESTTTRFLGAGAEQLSLTYKSSKTISQQYTEYKNYLSRSGYEITEGPANSSVRAIFGVKSEANLSVAISNSGGQTTVQLAYLLK